MHPPSRHITQCTEAPTSASAASLVGDVALLQLRKTRSRALQLAALGYLRLHEVDPYPGRTGRRTGACSLIPWCLWPLSAAQEAPEPIDQMLLSVCTSACFDRTQAVPGAPSSESSTQREIRRRLLRRCLLLARTGLAHRPTM